MKQWQLLETNSPLTQMQANQIGSLVQDIDAGQALWLSGFFAGIGTQHSNSVAALEKSQPFSTKNDSSVTVLYGSQTGNAEAIASNLCQRLDEIAIDTNLVSMGDYRLQQLKKEKFLMVVTSTQGEGEPPDDGLGFHEFVLSKKAPKLADLNYAVLSLGDSSYNYYCQTGKDFDERFSSLGAKALTSRVDCDVDYTNLAEDWIENLTKTLASNIKTQPTVLATSSMAVVEAKKVSKEASFNATLLSNQKITAQDSSKDTRHIEFSIEDSGISYLPGDSLGVWVKNDELLVSDLIQAAKLKADAIVTLNDKEYSLKTALTSHTELTDLHPGFVQHYGDAIGSQALRSLANSAVRLELLNYINTRQVIDVVQQYPPAKGSIDAQSLVAGLRKLTPRLYSIASSQALIDDEVHLTVCRLKYSVGEQQRYGLASHFLANRMSEDEQAPIYIQPNKHFRLPIDPSVPIIMVGPGTGVAPFRAFLQEREATGARGENWLLFGNPHFHSDFLYQIEWQQYLKKGLLTRMDVAFSRDQAEKIYVQHHLLANSRQLYRYLQNGGHFYICGDGAHMAKDVHSALITAIAKEQGQGVEVATDYVTQLKRANRYQRDVY